jgi:hypothetical protein
MKPPNASQLDTKHRSDCANNRQHSYDVDVDDSGDPAETIKRGDRWKEKNKTDVRNDNDRTIR